ncbi:PPOX class F420-dependent oxidoreductase [Nocardia sp. 2YAB30]|uniref:PPOX class F420-dependent oxidoreductase n=1 Tax=unclassified Nocardia TaxID=2637762 RepID=UPI003F97932C
MPTMTEEQWRAFISHGTRTGTLATVAADGDPRIAPLWFALDGNDLVFQTGKTSVKGRNLVRDPRFTLLVDDDRPLRGRVAISEDPDDVRYWAGRLGTRYMGEDRAEEYAARNGGPGIINIYGRIDTVVSFDGVAD